MSITTEHGRSIPVTLMSQVKQFKLEMITVGQFLSWDTDSELGVRIGISTTKFIPELCIVLIPTKVTIRLGCTLHISDEIVTNLREHRSLWCDVDIESTGVN